MRDSIDDKIDEQIFYCYTKILERILYFRNYELQYIVYLEIDLNSASFLEILTSVLLVITVYVCNTRIRNI